MLLGTFLNLNQNELRNASIQNLASAPSTPVIGQIYTNTSSSANTSLQVYMNVASVGTWVSLSTSASSIAGGGSTNQVAYFSGSNTLAGLSGNSSILVTSSSGVPSLYSYTATSGVALISTTTGAPTFGTVTLTQPASMATLTLGSGTTVNTGSYNLTFTTSATTNVTLPSGTTTLMSNPMTTLGDLTYGGASGVATRLAGPTVNGTYGISEVVVASTSIAPTWVLGTGSGSPVFATSPTFVTPVLGAATATSINGLVVTTTTGTLSIANNASASLATTGNFAITLNATAASTVTMPASTSATMLYYTLAPSAQYALPYANATSGLIAYVAPQTTNATYILTAYVTATAAVVPAWTAVSTSAPLVDTSGGSAGSGAAVAFANHQHPLSAAYQAASTNLGSIGSLANSAGYLYNNGSGIFTYAAAYASTPVADTSVGSAGSGTSVALGNHSHPISSIYVSASVMTTLGDMLYENATPAPARLAGPTVNGVYVLSENVTASASVAPVWLVSTGSGNNVLATSPSIATPTFTGGATFSTGTSSVSSGATLSIASGGTFTAQSGSTFTQSNTPVNASDVVNKAYVDANVQGLAPKPTASKATSTYLNATQAYTYNNGTSGVGATLTNNGTQAALIIDGVVCLVNDLILVKNEIGANAPYNGLYTVTTVGTGSTNWVLTRSVDMDQASEFDAAFIPVGNSANILSNGTQTVAINSSSKTIILSGSGTLNWTTLGASANTSIELAGFTVLTGNNGIYNIVSITTTTATNDTITYSTIFPDGVTTGSQVGGIYAYLTGTINSNTLWLCQSSGVFVVGTTPLTFTQLNSATNLQAGTNIVISGNNISLLATPTVTSINGLTINTTTGTLALANGSTITTTGAFNTTLAASATTTVTLPGASGTLVYYTSGNAPTAAYQVAYSAAASGSLQYAAVNSTATNYFLRQVSSGAPAFVALTSSDVTTALSYTPTKKYTSTLTVTAGSAGNSGALSHGLGNTNLVYSVIDPSGNAVIFDAVITSSTITVSWGFTSASGSYLLTVIG